LFFTVVDVYSEWYGPCLSMIANLKRFKLELGSDFLIYGTVSLKKPILI
jgi:hypothetical protein